MNLVVHQAKHEIRQIGWGLLVWALAGGYLLCAKTAQAGAGKSLGYEILLTIVSTLLVTLFGGALIAKTVQLDHPVESTAFWRTRPNSPFWFMAAKLTVLVAIFVLLPLGGMIFKSLTLKVEITHFVRTLLVLVALVLANAALGSVTKDLGRYLLAVLLGFFVFWLVDFVFNKAGHVAGAHVRVQSGEIVDNSISTFMAIVSFATLVCQYCYRRRWISYAILIGGFILLVAVRKIAYW